MRGLCRAGETPKTMPHNSDEQKREQDDANVKLSVVQKWNAAWSDRDEDSQQHFCQKTPGSSPCHRQQERLREHLARQPAAARA